SPPNRARAAAAYRVTAGCRPSPVGGTTAKLSMKASSIGPWWPAHFRGRAWSQSDDWRPTSDRQRPSSLTSSVPPLASPSSDGHFIRRPSIVRAEAVRSPSAPPNWPPTFRRVTYTARTFVVVTDGPSAPHVPSTTAFSYCRSRARTLHQPACPYRGVYVTSR